jgi:hypothetical protein
MHGSHGVRTERSCQVQSPQLIRQHGTIALQRRQWRARSAGMDHLGQDRVRRCKLMRDNPDSLARSSIQRVCYSEYGTARHGVESDLVDRTRWRERAHAKFLTGFDNGPALVAQGIEHRFPKPGVVSGQRQPRRTCASRISRGWFAHTPSALCLRSKAPTSDVDDKASRQALGTTAAVTRQPYEWDHLREPRFARKPSG